MLSGFQAREVILLVQETDVSGAFAKLDQYGVSTTDLEVLRREFISGKYDFTYYERLQMAVNAVASEHFETRTPDFDIFFSFSSKNLNAAVKEVQKLRDAGLKVFFSGDSLKEHVGQNFFEKIQYALESTQHFVLYGTREALASPWVKQEYQSFYQHVHLPDPKNRRFFIIKGKGFQISSLPLMMRGIQVGTTTDVIRSLRQQNAQGAQQSAEAGKRTTPPKRKPKPPKPLLSEAERQRRRQLRQRIGGGVGALLLLLLLGYGIFQLIPTEADRWQEAKAKASWGSLQTFVKEYPKTTFADTARSWLDSLDSQKWREADSVGTTDSYHGYQKARPGGKFLEKADSALAAINKQQEAAEQADTDAFKKARKSNTIYAYRQYLRSYPEGAFVAEAKNQLKSLQDSDAFVKAKRADTEIAYRAYLREYSSGAYVSEARKRLNQLEQDKQEKREAAQKQQDSNAFTQAKRVDTETAYKKYLADYPNGEYAYQAKQRLDKLETERKEREKPKVPAAVANLESQMVYVQGGTFTMGCTSEQSDCASDEKPTHQVTLSSFRMSKYEVTQALWEAVMGSNPSSKSRGIGSNYPVNQVSWNDIQTFLRKLNQLTGKNYRLPTEAEWEFAARGGTKSRGYKYAGSNSISSVAWYDGNSGSKTHPVGQKAPNELGLYDMSGNVWEWCQDWYGKGYYGSSRSRNPKGPSSSSYRVLRGGSWNSGAGYCRVAFRDRGTPTDRLSLYGFRLAL